MPRLTKGQIAVGIQVRQAQAMSSAKARIVAFQRLKSSNDRPLEEITKFSNFERLASWNDPQQGITPLSTKTLRKHLNALYEEGSFGFRRDVLQLLDKKSASKATYLATRKLGKQSADHLSADAVMEMTARYLDLLERLNRLAATSESAEVELQSHYRRYCEGGVKFRLVKK